MHRFAPVALATLLAASVPALLCAQAPTPFTVPAATGHFTDPANLAGERVRPRDGRELPIDGGLSANGQPDNALGLAQMLRRLSTRASLMLIVAHPDDEDGGMLTYYSRGLGARVAVLTLTRGEGGQNQMTGDFEDALGLLRTQELLSADRYMGVDQMFGTEVDFGFTKTKAEAFQKWNHERVLYDAVRAVRIYRPLVIAAVFSGAVTDGHGQHQVSGQIAQEVFKAAGDPNVFPELTREGILPWQPLKVYARVPFSRVTDKGLYDYATGQTVPAQFTNYVTGQTFTTEPTPDVTINEGATDPLLTTCAANPSDLPRSFSLLSSRNAGSASPSTTAKDCTPLSYVQFARIGLGLQRSQIGGGMRMPSPGRADVSYHLYGSRVCAPNLPNPTPSLCNGKLTTAANYPKSGWPTLSQSERVGYRAAREKTLSASPMLIAFTPAAKASTAFAAKAPTARPAWVPGQLAGWSGITAQGNALGTPFPHEPSAEGAPYNPALANEPSFFDGIDTSIRGIGDLAPDAPTYLIRGLDIVMGLISKAVEARDQPERLAPSLADALTATDRFIEQVRQMNLPTLEKENVLHELRVKRAELNEALALALGLYVDATAQSAEATVRSTVPVHMTLTKSTNMDLGSPGFSVNSADGNGIGTGPRSASSVGAGARPYYPSYPMDELIQATDKLVSHVTKPYFFRSSIEDPVYQLSDPQLRNAPQTPPALTASANVPYAGTWITVERVVHSGPQPVQIVPPVSVSLSQSAQVITPSAKTVSIQVTVQPTAEVTSISATTAPRHARSDGKPVPLGSAISIGKPDHGSFPSVSQVDVSINSTEPGTVKVSAHTKDSATYTEGFRPIGYGTLPRTNYYTPATLRVVPVDLKLPPENKRRIAYLPGTGDDVPAALASIGLTPTMLNVSDLTPEKLKAFDTVILGVRTYNAHPDLHGAPTQALFDFARNGGNVLVQYQTNEFSAADAPYPLELRGERVIDETAPVVLLTTENSQLKTDSQTKFAEELLTTPNRITSADFNNWIEERGHGFLDTWDSHYTALTETHDPGAPAEHIQPQAPQRGGLITVQLGKGRWTYCAFALYRQLPEAVPGAFRLFVNLLNP